MLCCLHYVMCSAECIMLRIVHDGALWYMLSGEHYVMGALLDCVSTCECMMHHTTECIFFRSGSFDKL